MVENIRYDELNNDSGSYSEMDSKRQEIQSTFSYDGCKIIREELFAHVRNPAVTIRPDGIMFNTACINALDGVKHVHLMINEEMKRLVIRGCNENDKDALRWCTVKGEQRKPRKMTGRLFSDLLYALMEWDKANRYKILGYKIEFEGEELFVFDLKVAEIFECSKKARKAAASPVDGEMGQETENPTKVSRKGYYSPDIANTFGLSIEEHRQAYSLTDLDGYVTIGTLTEGNNVDVSSVIKTVAEGGLQDRGQEVSVNTLSRPADRLSDRDITLSGQTDRLPDQDITMSGHAAITR